MGREHVFISSTRAWWCHQQAAHDALTGVPHGQGSSISNSLSLVANKSRSRSLSFPHALPAGRIPNVPIPESALIATCPKAKSVEITSVSNTDSSQEGLIKNTNQVFPDFNEANHKIIYGILSLSFLSLSSHVILVKNPSLRYNFPIKY